MREAREKFTELKNCESKEENADTSMITDKDLKGAESVSNFN